MAEALNDRICTVTSAQERMTPLVTIPSPYRPVITPLPSDGARPQWSVMIPTYHCASFLRATLSSVLAQDPGPALMQIEVVDDCSTHDDPAAVVAEIGRGRVSFYRQPRNRGHVGNFNTCLQRARGRFIHLLHGDDLVLPGFYARIGSLFAQHPQLGAAFCRHATVDEHGTEKWSAQLEQAEAGILQGWRERFVVRHPVQPPAIAVRREVYEHLGGFDSRMRTCGEDWEMWARIAVHYPIGYEPAILAHYRENSASLTRRALRSGQNLRDVRTATRIIGGYLPPSLKRRAAASASLVWARWGLYYTDQLTAAGDFWAAAVQLVEALRCNRSSVILNEARPLARRLVTTWLRVTTRRWSVNHKGIA